MDARRSMRAAGAWGHLLLVAVLALGVFAMHTTGHPDSGSGMTHSAAAPAPEPAPASEAAGPAGVTHPADTATGSGTGTANTTAATTGTGTTDGGGTAHDQGMAMDMSTLCVAVLAGWVLAVLLRAALSRRTEWLPALRALVIASLRPHPPPSGPDLARLSILRI
ncbi:hypothetical protein [Streptomyces sp. NPDC001889]